MQSFADLGVSRAVVRALADQNVSEPFAVQSLVIEDVLAGRDVLVRSPTGSGKTLAFGIPMVDRITADGPRPAALVLAPTRELATQIASDIRGIAHARALRVTAVYGGAGLVKQSREAATSHIVVATPGRLEDLLARRAFRLDRIRMLVLDEADRMLDMGFRPAVDRIVGACPKSRQTLFFSATLDRDAGRAAREYTVDPVLREHGPSGEHPRRRGRASLHRGRPHRPHRGADRRARARARPHAGVRPHQARRRPAGQAAGRPRRVRAGHARQQVTAPARAGAGQLRVRARGRPGRHRRGRPRDRRHRHLARDQLRSARRSRRLRPSRRPHRAAPASRGSGSPSSAPASAAT